MITTFYPPYNFGGDGIFVQRLSNELARRGHQVDVIHCLDAHHLLSSQRSAGTCKDHANVTVHGLRSPFGFLSPLATQQTGFPFFKSFRIQEILKKGFDVIHYHNISLVGGPRILEFGQAIKLYTMHDYWLVCPTHILFKFNRAPCARPHCFACTLAFKRPPQWWRYAGLLKSAINHVDTFIAPNRFTRDMHYNMGLDIPIVHLPHFVPATDDTASTLEEPSDVKVPETPYFLFVGRLEKYKGLQTLFPVFGHYPRAQLLIAGKGSYEQRLRQLGERSSNIKFLGHMTSRQLQTLYQQAIALIVPSLCFETFSLVILEAFKERTPVIVRNLGGMSEPVEVSGGGFIYNTDEELMVTMDRLLGDPSCRHELGLRGYQAYQQNWTSKVHLKRYLSLICKIATARRQGSD
jgi:glycosyltransferase involved in cell wall biosynthesis